MKLVSNSRPATVLKAAGEDLRSQRMRWFVARHGSCSLSCGCGSSYVRVRAMSDSFVPLAGPSPKSGSVMAHTFAPSPVLPDANCIQPPEKEG